MEINDPRHVRYQHSVVSVVASSVITTTATFPGPRIRSSPARVTSAAKLYDCYINQIALAFLSRGLPRQPKSISESVGGIVLAYISASKCDDTERGDLLGGVIHCICGNHHFSRQSCHFLLLLMQQCIYFLHTGTLGRRVSAAKLQQIPSSSNDEPFA